MKKKVPDPILMFLTILVIAGFQGYWIRDNYFRERKAVEIRANALFGDILLRVQDSVLKVKLGLLMKDSSVLTLKNRQTISYRKNANIDAAAKGLKVASLLGENIPGDTFSPLQRSGKGVFVRIRQQQTNDSTRLLKNYDLPGLSPEDIKQVLNAGDDPDISREANTLYFNDDQGRHIIIQIDSIFKNPVSPSLFKSAFQAELEREKLNVPYSIMQGQKNSSNAKEANPAPMKVFSNLLDYRLELGNLFPYLVRKIIFPILFSIFLIGFTVLTFVVLYRTLLKQQRLAAMKTEFISNITHELKTPIATVGVAIEALRNFGAAENPVQTREYLDISHTELQRLSLLVDKVLKLSLFENQLLELKKESFDLKELVEESLNIMKLQFDKQQATVTVTSSGENFQIEADRLHLLSVLYNLLDNALKYSPESPLISISVKELPRDILELKITDHGIGIPIEYQSKIFEKFFRVPMGDRHTIRGYGLGLSYVAEIIHQHMGYIVAECDPQKGTSFTIKIPRKEAAVIYFDDKRRMYKKAIKI